ncbi:hypothetical protein [Streptomyces sp. UH6]|uniref:hypothetical protein n=1 Tax=Streptomyces sp. UH6 TaxID=2748379 RepID=UPI0015D477CE|nr:hypothetical protein [Streptomyces sp. UH6]NYV75278.1 hypothetical protein [Streptomyces sp. UH6]
MQIVEITAIAARSAVITMRHARTPLVFVFFPMLHVASPAFYTEVRRRLAACDLVVLEGVRGGSASLNALTLAYRFAPLRRRNGLVEQTDERVLPEGVPVLRPDATSAEVVADLKAVSRWRYWAFTAAAPLLGLVFALRGPRVLLDRDLEVDDLPLTARAEALADDPALHALTDRRDRLLLEALGKIHAERRHEALRVAVVYGAAHVPAVVTGLWDRYGYRAREAEWVTAIVFD